MTDKKTIDALLPTAADIKDYRQDDDFDNPIIKPVYGVGGVRLTPKPKKQEVLASDENNVTVVENEDPEQVETELNQDFVIARRKIREAAEVASDVVIELKEIAEQSGHPRAYEVLNQSIKNLASVSRDLVELYKLKNDSKTAKEEQEDSKNITNNNLVFAGNTAELARILQNLKKK